MGAVSTFTTGNYPRQPATASLCLNSVDLSFLMEVKPDVIKDINFAKISESYLNIFVSTFGSEMQSYYYNKISFETRKYLYFCLTQCW